MSEVQAAVTNNAIYRRKTTVTFDDFNLSKLMGSVAAAIEVANDYELIARGVNGLREKGKSLDYSAEAIDYHLLPFAPRNEVAEIDETPGPNILGTAAVKTMSEQQVDLELVAVHMTQPLAILGASLGLHKIDADSSERRLGVVLDIHRKSQTVTGLIGKGQTYGRGHYDLEYLLINDMRAQHIEPGAVEG